MNPTLFIISITAFLVSVVSSLTVSFFSKFVSKTVLKIFFIIHLALITCWLFFRNENEQVLNPGASNYLFLAFCCSGIVVSSVVLRKPYSLVVKGYFLLFLLTIPLFIIAPSRLLGFITTGNPVAVQPRKFHLRSNYYLVELPGNSTANTYKVIREMGIFHKTLARDVILPGNTDSVRLVSFEENSYLSLRLFTAGATTDSTELRVSLAASVNESPRTITKGPKKNP